MVRRRVALVALVGLVGACGGGDDDERVLPLVGEIAPAVAAVEAARGGPQTYFEINATSQLVNLFVADEAGGTVVPYVYTAGELRAPGAPSPVSDGTPFEAAAVADDLAAVLDGVTDELPASDVSVFVVYPDETGAPRYGATVVSEEGGVLDVDLDADGDVLAVDPRP